MFTQGNYRQPDLGIQLPVMAALLLAISTLGPGTAHSSDTTPAAKVAATYFDGLARQEISWKLYRDYLLYHGAEEGAESRRHLESLALLLFLEAEELGAEPNPRVAFQIRLAEDRLLAASERRTVLAAITIDEKAVEGRVQELRREGRFQRPTKLHLSELFLRVPAGADAAARREVKGRVAELRQDVLDGANFAALARAESDSQNSANGGRLGVVKPGVLPEPLEAIAYGLDEGELSEVLESAAGFFFLRCDRIVKRPDTSLEEARSLVRKRFQLLATDESAEALRTRALVSAAPKIDIEAAGSETPDTIVLSFGQQRLSQREVAWLTRMEPGGSALSDMGPVRLQRVLEEYVVRTVLAGWRRARPLDEDLKRRIRWRQRSIRASSALGRRVRVLLQPQSAEELRAYFEAHPERFVHHELYRLAVLRIDVDSKEPSTAGRQIERLSWEIDSGTLTFGEAARRHSDHHSATEGGRVGWWSRKQLATPGMPLLRAVADLEPGATTAPIRQDRSWWILRLFEVDPSRPMTFEEARGRVEQALGDEQLGFLQSKEEATIRKQLDLR